MESEEHQHLTTGRLELKTESEHWLHHDISNPPRTPSEWFIQKFPEQVKTFGSPFLEMREQRGHGFERITPLSANLDFFAGILGGDKSLRHSVIYFEPEMQFYFYDPRDQQYKATSPEKLQNLLRA